MQIDNKFLFLDDSFERYQIFCQKLPLFSYPAISAKGAIKLMEKIKFDCVFLDHDLGADGEISESENNGAVVAQWMVDNQYNPSALIVIHSFNPVGAENMRSILFPFYQNIKIAPFNSPIFQSVINDLNSNIKE